MGDHTRGDVALLLLADSRLPAGGHAHSGGVEEAVRLGRVTGVGDLARFLRGRLATAGLVAAALAAAANELAAGAGNRAQPWRSLDAEADARTASPAQREAARTQGRLLLRTARRMWPSTVLDTLATALPQGPHHPVALGAAACCAGCDPRQAALAAAYTSVTGPATAAVRLLGLDPVTVHRLLADLSPTLDETALAACASLIDAVVPDVDPADDPAHGHVRDHARERAREHTARERGAGRRAAWASLPGHSAPALDLLAESHLANPMKLFVS